MLPSRRLVRLTGVSGNAMTDVHNAMFISSWHLPRRHRSDMHGPDNEHEIPSRRAAPAVSSPGTSQTPPTTPSAKANARKKKNRNKNQKVTPPSNTVRGPSATPKEAITTGSVSSQVDALDALLATAPTTLRSWGPSETSPAAHATATETATRREANRQLGDAAEGNSDAHLAEQNAHHRNAQFLNQGDTIASGARYSELEKIERRRSKITVAEAEFTVGVTERLFPELPRLPALHEVHFGDSVVREVDAQVLFAQLERTSGASTREAHNGSSSRGGDEDETASAVAEHVVTDVSDDAFAEFETQVSAPSSREHVPAAATEPTSQHDVGETPFDEQGENDAMEDAVVPYAHTAKPWFVPDAGVIRTAPLPPDDVLRLLALVLYLRHPEEVTAAAAAAAETSAGQQASSSSSSSSSVMESIWRSCWTSQLCEALLPLPALREKVKATCVWLQAGGEQQTTDKSPLLRLSDVIAYLDTAPVPVLGFTELLHPRDEVETPAFVFTLYVENVSVQNALGHLAALFAVPQRAFYTHTAASKMSCTSLLCAVEHNRLTRELLLLINTMRHPGFVLRVSCIQSIDPRTFSERGIQDVFGALARWQPVYEVEMLLRRVSTGGKDALLHRLRALQNVGAVFFCANREASLARAATDVLHGFYRSAVLNALQRRKPPLAMKQFFSSPNAVTAGRARRASTDPAIRHVLKTFIQTNGDWKETVARAPYVWRRRWLNALRCTVWNTMASRRLRHGGRHVLVGDIVVRPEFRADVHRRQITNLKAEHVKLVETEEEAAQCSLEDLFLPFLRGTYPAHLVAPDSSHHPVLTSAKMFSLVQGLHAGPLLTGLSETSRVLLDIRADISPMLFRRLLLRPLALEFTILEDKAPFKSIHYDAARLLASDRWAAYTQPQACLSAPTPTTGTATTGTSAEHANALATADTFFLCGAGSSLVSHAAVIDKTSMGARLTSGALAEDAFSVPSPHEYLALGHARRYLDGAMFASTPHTPQAELDDRLYTVHLRAVTQNGSVGLTQLLREYFVLGGVEDDIDSALQHKIHRLRRELDPETPLLTASSYCTGCYGRDHDALDMCAEFLFKKSQSSAWARQRVAVTEEVDTGATMPQLPLQGDAHRQVASASGAAAAAAPVVVPASTEPHAALPLDVVTSTQSPTLCLTWQLRRRNAEEKWGVHLTKDLHLVGIEHVHLIEKGSVFFSAAPLERAEEHSGTTMTPVSWPAAVVKAVQSTRLGASCVGSTQSQNDAVNVFLSRVIAATLSPSSTTHHADELTVSPRTLSFSGATRKETEDSETPNAEETATVSAMKDLLALFAMRNNKKNAHVSKTTAEVNSARAVGETTEASGVLRRCAWQLHAVNGIAVRDRRDVAAVFLKHKQDRVITLTFTSTAAAATIGSTSATPEALTEGTAREAADKNAASRPGETQSRQFSATAATTTTTTASSSSHALTPFMLALSDPHVQAALRRASYGSRRWLAHLPQALRMVLTKHRRHYRKHPSWGLKIDGRDMALVNFSSLMVQYMFASDSKQRLELVERAYVSSLSPSKDAFPRNDEAMASQLFSDVLPHLEALLNQLYTVATINGKRVHDKTDAAAAMASFQQAVEQSRVLDARHAPNGEVHLAITLTRKPETMTWLSRIAAEEVGGAALSLPPPVGTALEAGRGEVRPPSSLADDLAGFELAEPMAMTSGTADAEVVGGGGDSVAGEAGAHQDTQTTRATTSASTHAASGAARLGWARDASVLCVLPSATATLTENENASASSGSAAAAMASMLHAPWLSAKQLKSALVTIAINRRLTNAQTQGKWGLRVQRGTLRLLRVQKNQFFGFQVYSAKRAQAVRIADTLRDAPMTLHGDSDTHDAQSPPTHTDPQASHVQATHARGSHSYADFLYFVEGVNHIPVRSHQALKTALQRAASPSPAAGLWRAEDADGSGSGDATASAPESVTLQIRQMPLARVAIPITRRGQRFNVRHEREESGDDPHDAPSSSSSSSSLGLHINKDMCIVGVEAEGLCAAALHRVVAPHCSLMSLIRPRALGKSSAKQADDALRPSILHPDLNTALAAVGTHVMQNASQARQAGRTPPRADRAPVAARGAWRYELDEDDVAPAELAAAGQTEAAHSTALHASELSADSVTHSLRNAVGQLGQRVESLLDSYRQCSGVDAVALLQASVMNEFCQSCQTVFSSLSPSQSEADVADAIWPLWEELESRLAELKRGGADIRWRVVYAATSKQTLRTPADLAAAVGPGVKEEVLVVQQCIVLS